MMMTMKMMMMTDYVLNIDNDKDNDNVMTAELQMRVYPTLVTF